MAAHAAFIRLLQVDLSSALECLYKGAGFEHGAGGAAGGGDGSSYAMAAVAMAGMVVYTHTHNKRALSSAKRAL